MTTAPIGLHPRSVAVEVTEVEIGAEIVMMGEGGAGRGLHAGTGARLLGVSLATICRSQFDDHMKFQTFKYWLSIQGYLGECVSPQFIRMLTKF
jgi:hypothetical protein